MAKNYSGNKATMQKIVDIFNSGDLSEVELIFSPDYVDHQRPSDLELTGPAEFKAIVEGIRQSLRAVTVTIEDLIGEADKVVGRLQWDLIDLTGKAIRRETIDILRLVNGQVVEHWGAEAWRIEHD
jgi:predicted ester cyclase